LGESPHVHRILDRGLFAKDRLFRGTADRDDIEIEFWREAAIQAQFFAAIKVARFQRGKIKEAKIYGFLDFVRIMPGQQHPGDVRLFNPGLAGKIPGCAQGIHQLLLAQQVR
jgi:hypothetical protein